MTAKSTKDGPGIDVDTKMSTTSFAENQAPLVSLIENEILYIIA